MWIANPPQRLRLLKKANLQPYQFLSQYAITTVDSDDVESRGESPQVGGGGVVV